MNQCVKEFYIVNQLEFVTYGNYVNVIGVYTVNSSERSCYGLLLR